MIKMEKKTVGIYARVSTEDQNVDNQLKELRAFCKRKKWKIFSEYIDEGISGAKESRPELDRILKDVFKKKFDILLVWKLDRLGRSLKQLIEILDELKARDIDFISFNQNIDTTTATGKLMYQIIGAFAEFERDLISERVKAGMERAKSEGKQIGRPRLIPGDKMSRTTLWRRKKMYMGVSKGHRFETQESQ